MKHNSLTDQEKKGVATAAGVAAGVAAGGAAAYAATQTGAEAKAEAEEPKPEIVSETHEAHHTTVQNNVVSEVEVVVENEPPVDNTPTVEVLSYDTVEYEGHLIDSADVRVDGTIHRYVDIDQDGYAEIEGVDDNHDGYFADDEIHDLKPQTVSMNEFKEAYTTPGGGANDEFLALNDEGPDYVDDVSYHDSGIDGDVMV